MERSALLTPTMEGASDIFSGVVLIAAGIYQWTPLKDICLRQCQAPWLFIQRHGGFRSDIAGTLGLGMRHGGYCIGCCWVLMALLFVGGVMNVLWIAAIAMLVVPVGNLRPEILVMQSAQNWHRQRATYSLDGTRDRRVLVQR